MKMAKFIGLVAAIAALVMAPNAALAQKKGAAPAGIPESAKKAGMAEAPAVVQTLALPCQISEARLIGSDKKTATSFYEVACGAGNMGYVLQAPKAGTPNAFSCVEANYPPNQAAPSAPCLLPGNAKPEALLTAMLAKSGINCVPEKARSIGQTKTETFVEVACQGGQGYITIASAPFETSKPIKAQTCLLYDANASSNVKCEMGDPAARLAIVDTYVKAANNNCVVKGRRFVGMAKDNSSFYEASCEDGKGYIYKVDQAGALAQTYECAKAGQILGGCELTDARQAATEQAALYTKLAKAAGSNCEVERYALFPPKPGEEDVEMVCKDGSNAIGIFKSGGKGEVLNCSYALIAGFRCGLGKPDSGYSFLTADLKKQGKDSCVVSNSRLVGRTEKGSTLVEVACADGLKGYIIEYTPSPIAAVSATGCAFAGNCNLPGNK